VQRSEPTSAEAAAAAAGPSVAAGLAAGRGGLWAVNFVLAVFTCLWTACWIVAALVVRAVTRDVRAPLAMARRCWAPGLLYAGGMRVEIEGTENVDFSQPHFFAANHQSLVDALVLFYVVPVPLLFILKEELSRVPFLGAYVAAMGMIFIRRGERRRSLDNLEQCRGRLDAGMSIAMFPEGTRSRDGRVAAFKTAVFLPAIDTGVPVVPVALEGPGRILPPGTFKVRPGRIRVAFGRPVPTAGLDRRDRRRLAEEVRRRIVELRQELRRSGSGDD
jgi:1-acyl-sn-glycerol-3-phosphate acyltransferase